MPVLTATTLLLFAMAPNSARRLFSCIQPCLVYNSIRETGEAARTVAASAFPITLIHLLILSRPRGAGRRDPSMVQGYYTLQEAADFLGMPQDELKQMAQKKDLRSFQDRGTLRFRIQ